MAADHGWRYNEKGVGNMLCLAEETKELFVIAAEPGICKLKYKII